ncbi:hypothetical protein N0V82_006704 [Gnomoniopsis sp. IMI 355080]|nr:hypothetical protein N0V82_006704 [Gnomoniopsis sp. IMI 355080]
MLKPRLRIPRRGGLLRPVSTPCPTQSPFAAAATTQLQQQRSIQTATLGPHRIPELPYADKFLSEGVPNIYSKEGFAAAWSMYMEWCLGKLNERIAGQGFEDKTVKEIAIITSREARSAAIFNYASMAHNTHFYFESIAPHGGEDPYEHMPEDLRKQLVASFGSLETLQSDMLNTANAMFGPGFVWLVRQRNTYGMRGVDPFRILTTYQAGSPYPQAHWRGQGTDMNSEGGFDDKTGSVIRNYYNMMNKHNNRPQLHGNSTGLDVASRSPGGADVVPVLCVNTWEHAWMFDHGIGGKEQFLGRWWNVIHWGKVAERAQLGAHKPMSASPDMGQFGRPSVQDQI